MDRPRLMLDSNILIDTLNHKLDLQTYLDSIPECDAYINLVVEIEVLAKADMTEDEETAARALLNSFKWAEIDKSTREIAVQIRRTSKLRLPDVFIAASSIALNAAVLSNDPHLRDYKHPGYTAMPCVQSV